MKASALKLVLGPAFAAVTWFATSPLGMPEERVAVLSAAAWMLVWWVAEAVPLGVTSVLPLVLFPALGVTDVASAAAPYGSKFVFLFMGGFLIALALERWNLHRRFALRILVAAGGRPRRLLGGFMLATAALSMWISNTATTLMMLPIALSVVAKIDLDAHPRFPVALLLGTAYAANLGGIATLVGTPPNVAMAGLLEEHVDIAMPFLEWTLMALPFSAIMLVLVYLLLTRVLCRVSPEPLKSGVAGLKEELKALGPWGMSEKRVAWVFAGTALMWVARRWLVEGLGWPLNDTSIAMAAGVLLFVIPSGDASRTPLLSWEDTRRMPWDILLLFGGGIDAGRTIGRGRCAFGGGGCAGLHAFPVSGVADCWLCADVVVSHGGDEQPRAHGGHGACGGTRGTCLGHGPLVARGARDHGEQLRVHVAYGHASQCHCLWEWPASHGHHGPGGGGAQPGGSWTCVAVGGDRVAVVGATSLKEAGFRYCIFPYQFKKT